MLKTDEEIQELQDNDTEIFQKNNISRYSERPKQLKDWCLADYVAHLEYKPPKDDPKVKVDPFEDNVDDDFERNSDDESGDEIETLPVGDKVHINIQGMHHSSAHW